ncbi:MAG: phosphodiester glycosidase family protein, partial [Armatimonadaceae bacterium]
RVVGPLPTSVRYAFLSRSSPRPLQIHIVSIDLRDPGLSFSVVAAKDPDGTGPAETTLTAPKVLASQSDALVAINTAAWSMLPDPVTGKTPGYVAGGKADIHGWVENAGKAISAPEAGFWSVWMDVDDKVSIGMVPTIGELRQRRIRAQWAVSGFAGILQDGRVLSAPSDVRHPRTAVGITKDGNTLVWMVVDGRQRGFSEGVSEEELARLLLEAGCEQGINLDGGGSSSLWIRDANGRPGLINRPSDVTGPRPVPVMLVVNRSGASGIGNAGRSGSR